jgi:hypothetical protein
MRLVISRPGALSLSLATGHGMNLICGETIWIPQRELCTPLGASQVPVSISAMKGRFLTHPVLDSCGGAIGASNILLLAGVQVFA